MASKALEENNLVKNCVYPCGTGRKSLHCQLPLPFPRFCTVCSQLLTYLVNSRQLVASCHCTAIQECSFRCRRCIPIPCTPACFRLPTALQDASGTQVQAFRRRFLRRGE